MSHVRKGMLGHAQEWARHLRKAGRRLFWGQERARERSLIHDELCEHDDLMYIRPIDSNGPTYAMCQKCGRVRIHPTPGKEP